MYHVVVDMVILHGPHLGHLVTSSQTTTGTAPKSTQFDIADLKVKLHSTATIPTVDLETMRYLLPCQRPESTVHIRVVSRTCNTTPEQTQKTLGPNRQRRCTNALPIHLTARTAPLPGSSYTSPYAVIPTTLHGDLHAGSTLPVQFAAFQPIPHATFPHTLSEPQINITCACFAIRRNTSWKPGYADRSGGGAVAAQAHHALPIRRNR